MSEPNALSVETRPIPQAVVRPAGPAEAQVPTPPQMVRTDPPDWLLRLVLAGLLAGAAALAWWSLKYRLLPLQQQSKQLSASITRLSTELEQLEEKTARAETPEALNQFRQAQAKLFTDQGAVVNWLADLKEQTDALGLEAKTEFGKSQVLSKPETGLAIIPSTISLQAPVRPSAGSKEPAYQRLVRLSQRLAEQSKRADLMEVRVEGGTNSADHAVFSFHLWAGAEEARL